MAAIIIRVITELLQIQTYATHVLIKCRSYIPSDCERTNMYENRKQSVQ